MSQTYTQTYCMCPWCGEQSGCRVDHLFAEAPRTAGGWFCRECRREFLVDVRSPSEVIVSRGKPDRRFIPCATLLALDGADGPVYFVMDDESYEDGPVDTDEELQSSRQFFFEEHSCPMNWIGNCRVIVKAGDDDPHGVLRFVRSVRDARGFDLDAREQVQRLFPEAYRTGESK